MDKVKFNATRAEAMKIGAIVQRYMDLLAARPGPQELSPRQYNRTRADRMMDLDACHSNGCPLDFDKLLGFDDFNLLHDVGGIAQHLDRETGKLGDHFLPRSHA